MTEDEIVVELMTHEAICLLLKDEKEKEKSDFYLEVEKLLYKRSKK